MFETNIQFKGEQKRLKFASWGIGENLSKIANGEVNKENHIKVMAYIIFFGIIEGERLRSKYDAQEDIGFDVYDCFDWIDEQGGIDSEEVERIVKLYSLSREKNVPKNSKATAPKGAKATSQKK